MCDRHRHRHRHRHPSEQLANNIRQSATKLDASKMTIREIRFSFHCSHSHAIWSICRFTFGDNKKNGQCTTLGSTVSRNNNNISMKRKFLFSLLVNTRHSKTKIRKIHIIVRAYRATSASRKAVPSLESNGT